MPRTPSITTFSSRQFNHNAGGAKKSADLGPVFITDRGRPAYVLLSFADYGRLTRQHTKIADLLSLPAGQLHIDLPIPERCELARAADLSE